jgi:hypothetical protein
VGRRAILAPETRGGDRVIWRGRARQAVRQRQPSLQGDGYRPRQLLPLAVSLTSRRSLAPRNLDRTTGLSQEEWESTDLRTLIFLAALTGFVMRMLLGLLGVCVYVTAR